MSQNTVYARAVAVALGKHLISTCPQFYWACEKDRQWPYAPSLQWPAQPSLDFHCRDSGEGLVVCVVHNNDANPIAGQVLLSVKFTVGLAQSGSCIEAMAKFFRDLDLSAL